MNKPALPKLPAAPKGRKPLGRPHGAPAGAPKGGPKGAPKGGCGHAPKPFAKR